MTGEMTIQELVDETRRLQKRFQELESPPWTIETYVMELLAEAGTLADHIMIKEGYRQPRPGEKINLEDAVSDVLFVLLMIANHYGISLEDAYASMLRDTFETLFLRKNVGGSFCALFHNLEGCGILFLNSQ